MTKKQSTNKLLIIIILILICIIVYVTMIKKPKVIKDTVQKANSSQSSVTQTKDINWENSISEITAALGPSFVKMQTKESQPVSILDKADITGDNTEEALVDLGTGGATTDDVSLMMLVNGKPALPLFKDKDGKVSTLTFTSGGGGGGRYGSTVKMLSSDNSLYYASYYQYGEKSDYCSAVIYKWNPSTKIFEYNSTLSTKTTKDYCVEIGMNP